MTFAHLPMYNKEQIIISQFQQVQQNIMIGIQE